MVGTRVTNGILAGFLIGPTPASQSREICGRAGRITLGQGGGGRGRIQFWERRCCSHLHQSVGHSPLRLWPRNAHLVTIRFNYVFHCLGCLFAVPKTHGEHAFGEMRGMQQSVEVGGIHGTLAHNNATEVGYLGSEFAAVWASQGMSFMDGGS